MIDPFTKFSTLEHVDHLTFTHLMFLCLMLCVSIGIVDLVGSNHGKKKRGGGRETLVERC